MAKLQTLEHLDGKQVRFSTITSQYPELFVKRKRNTGELIISTDTDTKYGMHHIYAGGEHIAGGYGFATVKMRNDLTYIQETYNGIFDYFNQAYTYHNNAYDYLSTYVKNSYAYIKQSIYDNSYKRIIVDENNNSIQVDKYTYILSAEFGKLALYPENKKFMQFNTPEKYYLKKSFATYNTTTNDGIIYMLKDAWNISAGVSHAVIPVSLTKYKYTTEPHIEYTYTFYTSDENLNITSNGRVWTPETFNTYMSEKGFIENDETVIQVPIRYNVDTYIYCNITTADNSYTYTVDGITYSGTYYTTNESCRMLAKWVDGVMIYNTNTPFNEITLSRFIKDSTNILTNIHEYESLHNIHFPINENTYTYIFIPNAETEISPRFYVSNDLHQKENNEGGFVAYYLEDKDKQNSILNNTYYNVYISEPHSRQTTFRYDIDFINENTSSII